MSKYVYIMGRGHSGSTVLDCLLDNARGVQGIGETVVGLPKHPESMGRGERGEKINRFWSNVKDKYNEISVHNDWNLMVELYKEQAHISNFMKTLFSNRENNFIKESIKAVKTLYNSVIDVSGNYIIVDSSKEITRALLIAKYIDDGYIIHLVRDPVSVLYSDIDRIVNKNKFRFLRTHYNTGNCEPLFVAFTCINWLIGNALCELVKSKFKSKCITVRYEDIKLNTKKTLGYIGNKIDVDMSNVVEKIESNDSMGTGIGLKGNRMRRDKLEFVFDKEKEDKNIPLHYEYLCKTITYPLRSRYGYSDSVLNR